MADEAEQEGGRPVARIVLTMDEDGFLECQFDVPDKQTLYAMLGLAREKVAVETAKASILKERRKKKLQVVGPNGMPGPKH